MAGRMRYSNSRHSGAARDIVSTIVNAVPSSGQSSTAGERIADGTETTSRLHVVGIKP